MTGSLLLALSDPRTTTEREQGEGFIMDTKTFGRGKGLQDLPWAEPIGIQKPPKCLPWALKGHWTCSDQVSLPRCHCWHWEQEAGTTWDKQTRAHTGTGMGMFT